MESFSTRVPNPNRVAFISDVHSNLEALQAVLRSIDSEVPIMCLGDIVGYGASPNEVIAELGKRKVMCISGNHDWAVRTGRVNDFTSRAAIAALWTARHLSDESRTFLSSLAEDTFYAVGPSTRVYATHGSPDDHLWEYVLPATHEDVLELYLRRLAVQAIAVGHSHIPFTWTGTNGVVFNPGSVGQPRDGDPRASFAILTLRTGGLSIDHRRVAYDVEGAARKIRDAGLPESLATRLSYGE